MMKQYWQVDAFTDYPFKGNPAAVILFEEDEDFPSSNQCQEIAAHLNLSQTAFARKKGQGRYHIRWFSPKDEAPICGHATLATAHVLFFEKNIDINTITFESLAGDFIVSHQNNFITLCFPKKDVYQTLMPSYLLDALNINENDVLNVMKDSLIYIVELKDEETVRQVIPQLSLIKKIDCRAICITAKSDHEEYQFVSRYFAPSVGIDEDPVCGSAHCRLMPYWGKKIGKNNLIAKQVSRRSGVLHLEEVNETIKITSTAYVIAEGRIRI